MRDFALVIFESGETEKKPAGGFIKALPAGLRGLAPGLLFKTGILKSGLFTRLFFIIKKKCIEDGVKKVELNEDINGWILKLPFAAARLSMFDSNAIKAFIGRFCAEKGITGCYMPAGAVADAAYEDYGIGRGAGQLIYKAHLQYILEDIYESGGIRLGSLDTVIVAGEDRQELFRTVKLLEPNFKYISVAACKDRDIEEELAEISADTGLTINICTEYKSVLRGADLIINLAGAPAVSKYRMKPGSLVLNFNSGAGARMQGENAAINGIDYLLPADMFAGLGTEVLRQFNKKELTEAVMEATLGDCTDGPPDNIRIARALEEFRKCGCRITGYVGRRGSLKTENIIRAIRSRHIPGLG
jgi:hypothetical protein